MHRSTKGLASRLLGGAAMGALVAMAASNAFAAAAGSGETAVEEVVVTGTSIRGVAPVGANVIAVGREEIQSTGAQTVQQLLASVPQVTGFNNVGQGGFGSSDGSGTNAPTIHSLGASASNGTLVLIDGHRMPLSGLNHTLADPSVIAPSALERVEVLPDGSSAVYGSDAVAGVLNFITRRNYDGLETSAQVGFADGGYHTTNFNMVYGNVWDTGSALLSYGYSFRSALNESERSFIRTDLRPLGGTSNLNFNCSPAAVRPSGGQPGANLNYAYPYTAGSGVATNNAAGQTNGFCDVRSYSDAELVPMETRHSVLAKFEQKLGERLTASVDLVYSQRQGKQNGNRGTVTATVYGPGSNPPGGAGQINPFFRGPPGVTQEQIMFDFNELLGPGQITKQGAETKFLTFGLEYEMGRDWVANFYGTFGQDDSYSRNSGSVCGACATLALNGTVLQNGSTTTPATTPLLGTNTFITRLPLTTANALDVWSPAGQNRTSAAVLQQIQDNESFNTSRQNIENVKFTMGGPLFSLPGGDIKVSMGAEGIRYSLRQFNTANNSTGPISTNARFTQLDYSRNVYAFFGETVVPIIGPDNAQPWLQRLDLSGAVRYDHYNDFGSTTNPKVAFTLETIPGLSFRGSYGTSFTAPALTSRGDANGITGESGFGAAGTQTVPATFPGVTNLPGCNPVPAAGCQIGGTNRATGISVGGGNKLLQPATGKTWSIGTDFSPSFLPGFRASVTYWTAKYNGLITTPTDTAIFTTPGLYYLLIINPTPAQIAEQTAFVRQNNPLPTNIDYIFNGRQVNAFNLDASGLDVDVRYRLSTDNLGDFTFQVGFSDKLKFKQAAYGGGTWVDNLNVSGVNTTFSSLKFTGRASIGWRMDAWTSSLAMNYSNPYYQRSTTNVTQYGPKGQRVSSYTTFDLNIGYEFGASEGLLSGLELTFNARNLLDKNPPFVNVNGGYNSSDSNPIGRTITFGVRKEW